MLKIAAIAFDPLPGDVENNLGRMQQIILRSQNIDLLVFPEGALVGYPLGDMVNNADFIRRVEIAEQKLYDFWKKISGVADVIYGSIRSTGDQKTANTANILHVVDNVAQQNTVQKTHLPNYNVFDDKRNFVNTEPNDKVFEIRGHRLGVLICEDVWYPEPTRDLIARGAELLVAINGSPAEITMYEGQFVTKPTLRRLILRKYTTVPVLYVNLNGALDEIAYDGDVFAINIFGEGASLTVEKNITLDDNNCFVVHDNNCFLYDNNRITMLDEHYEIIPGGFNKNLAGSRKLEDAIKAICAPYSAVEDLTKDYSLQYIHYMLKTALRHYIIRNGFQKVVLGLSGGLDSAVVASLAADAIGAENVMCLLLPSRYSSDHSISDALQMCKLNNIPHQQIYIEHAVEQLRQTLRQHQIVPQGTVDENLQARVRANILMAYSNANNALLLSTGNKSELSMGYSTLGGDSMGGFNPLKDIYKTVVFALALYINNTQGATRIPMQIITKPPSAELRPDQKDTDSLPAYNVLDEILCGYLEHHQDSQTILESLLEQNIDMSEQRLNQIIKTLHRAEYKRRMGCPGVLISQLFNSSRRYPITNMAFRNA